LRVVLKLEQVNIQPFEETQLHERLGRVLQVAPKLDH
jgi:hypothetical protein